MPPARFNKMPPDLLESLFKELSVDLDRGIHTNMGIIIAMGGLCCSIKVLDRESKDGIVRSILDIAYHISFVVLFF